MINFIVSVVVLFLCLPSYLYSVEYDSTKLKLDKFIKNAGPIPEYDIMDGAVAKVISHLKESNNIQDNPNNYIPLEWSELYHVYKYNVWGVRHKYKTLASDNSTVTIDKVYLLRNNVIVGIETPDKSAHSTRYYEDMPYKQMKALWIGKTIIYAGKKPRLDQKVAHAVTTWIQKNSSKYYSYRPIEWSPIFPHNTGLYWCVRHKYQIKNKFDTLVTNNIMFMMQFNKVIKIQIFEEL